MSSLKLRSKRYACLRGSTARGTITEVTCDFPETSYGIVKRVQVFSRWIEDFRRRERQQTVSILDYGCGTGFTLTRPLGRNGHQILGVDPHAASVEAAIQQNRLENVRYIVGDLSSLLDRGERFDVIVCSEVLEHLETPETHLRGFNRLLNTPGLLMVSVPNGYGPFERLRHLERQLDRLGSNRLPFRVGRWSRNLGRKLLRSFVKPPAPMLANTLNESSPHVNFFRLSDLQALCQTAGFEVIDIRGRSLVCGPYADFWLNRRPFRLLLPLNNALADWLPLRFCSDWMLLLRATA